MPDGMHGLLGKRHDLIYSDASPLGVILDQVERVASSDATVLLTGETGTGKEVIARTLHKLRVKATGDKGAFVPVNCGAIPENLIEAELFGHARGAFTGAHAARKGRVAMAEGGTLFLDEIGELPLALQVKLLRLLQERTYEPVGDSRTLKASFRLVAATNRDLAQEVQAGRFRADLYYRLFVCPIELPALRDRPSDVPLLIEHFWSARGETRSFDPAVMQQLAQYSWPGNIRELENLVERVSVCAVGAIIRPSDLPPHIRAEVAPDVVAGPDNCAFVPAAGAAPSMPEAAEPQMPWLQSSAPMPNAPIPNAPIPYAQWAQGVPGQPAAPQAVPPSSSAPFPARAMAAENGWHQPVAAAPAVESLPSAANEDGERRAALVHAPAPAPITFDEPMADASAPAAVAELSPVEKLLASVELPRELPLDLPTMLRHIEWAFIDEALEKSDGNKQAAANLLGLRRTTLVEKLRRKKAAQEADDKARQEAAGQSAQG